MGILSRLFGQPDWAELSSRLGALEEEKALDGRSGPPTLLELVRGSTIPKRGTLELLQAYRGSPWLRSVVERVAEGVGASFVPELNAGRGSKRRIIEEHPLLDLLNDPCPALSPVDAWTVPQLNQELAGNAFSVKERNVAGVTVELWPCAAHWMDETPYKGHEFFRMTVNGLSRTVSTDDVLWMRSPDPSDPYGRGTGLGEALNDTIDTTEYSEQFIKSYFVNHGLPDAILAMKGASSDEVDKLDAKLKSKYSGPKRAHRIHLTNRELEVKRLDTSFKDQDLVALQRWLRDIVVQVYGIPPEIFGILESSTRSSIEAAEYLFCARVIVPRLKRLVSELNRTIVPEYEAAFPELGTGLWLGFESPVPADLDSFLRAVATTPGAFFAGEVRKKVGLPPSAIDGERLTNVPVVTGPTNLPPGKKTNGATTGIPVVLFDQTPTSPPR
jgi:HK97 family phage portal protein